MRRARAAGLAALLVLLIAGAADTDQVQQTPWAETTEGIGINITCQNPKTAADSTHWYRQFPHQAPKLIATAVMGTKPVLEPKGSLTVSADRRSSWLWLAEPRRGDAAVYYCALGATGRGAGAAAGHEPPRAGPGGASRGRCRSARRGRRAPLVPSCRAGAATRTDTDTGNGTDTFTGNGTDTSTDTHSGTHRYQYRQLQLGVTDHAQPLSSARAVSS
ncbi:uncharacterized protein LOC141731468 [Zonotrichia albicollis]|uniref:uncharacterized protein LOC141731468 n=1 Tax=Zonotrichia albicollis TaxID=44394 RepID=UPI003D80E16B